MNDNGKHWHLLFIVDRIESSVPLPDIYYGRY